MSVYNGERYLSDSIESILSQSFRDFEFIIINDGSKDRTESIIKSFDDDRIKYVKQTNHGLIYSLNKGIEISSAPYVARQDDDDISLPNRLEEQVQYLDKHSDVVLVGSAFEVMDQDGRIIYTQPTLTEDEDLRREMLVHNPIGHGTVLMRREAALSVGGYRKEYLHIEDYDLWRNIANEGKLANLPKVLYRWRVNLNGISQTNSSYQSRAASKLTQELWKSWGPKMFLGQNVKKGSDYYHTIWRGHGDALRNWFLENHYRFSIQLFRHGYIGKGSINLLRTLFAGRASIKTLADMGKLWLRHRISGWRKRS